MTDEPGRSCCALVSTVPSEPAHVRPNQRASTRRSPVKAFVASAARDARPARANRPYVARRNDKGGWKWRLRLHQRAELAASRAVKSETGRPAGDARDVQPPSGTSAAAKNEAAVPRFAAILNVPLHHGKPAACSLAHAGKAHARPSFTSAHAPPILDAPSTRNRSRHLLFAPEWALGRALQSAMRSTVARRCADF